MVVIPSTNSPIDFAKICSFSLFAKTVIFLTKEELLKLYNYEIPPCGTKVKLIDIGITELQPKFHH